MIYQIILIIALLYALAFALSRRLRKLTKLSYYASIWFLDGTASMVGSAWRNLAVKERPRSLAR